MASMPLLWLWFPKFQKRQALGLARAPGKGDIVLEVLVTRVLGEEKTAVLEGQKYQRGGRGRAWLWTLSLTPVGWAGPLLSSNQFGVSCCRLES